MDAVCGFRQGSLSDILAPVFSACLVILCLAVFRKRGFAIVFPLLPILACIGEQGLLTFVSAALPAFAALLGRICWQRIESYRGWARQDPASNRRRLDKPLDYTTAWGRVKYRECDWSNWQT